MKILSIGSDYQIFDSISRMAGRHIEYAQLFEQTHVIALTKLSQNFKEIQLSDKLWAYPTNSSTALSYINDTLRIAGELFNKVHFDLVTTQDPFLSGWIGYLLKKRFKIKLYVQIHTDLFSPYFKKVFWRNRIYFLIAKKIVKNADRIRVVSRNIKENLEKQWQIPSDKIDVLPIFVDVAEIGQGDIRILADRYRGYSPRLLVVSRLTKEKNVELIVRTMPLILGRYPKTVLIIVGDGPEKNKIIKLVKGLDLEKNVDLTGFQARLKDYYASSTALILPSFYEGFGLVVVEAFVNHLPVIMTPVGPMGDLFLEDENVMIFPQNDKMTLFKKIDQLMSEPMTKQKLVNNAKRVIDSLPKKDEYMLKYKNSVEQAIKS